PRHVAIPSLGVLGPYPSFVGPTRFLSFPGRAEGGLKRRKRMITDRDKAYAGGLVAAFIVKGLLAYLASLGMEVPAEVGAAFGVLINWGAPALVGVVIGLLVYFTPNKQPVGLPEEVAVLPYRDSNRK
ncbi:MAG: hypothetical protein ACREIQ_00945, partial [Nitrospiria bacterium]